MSTMTQTTVQVYNVFIKATPDAIWDAITRPEFTTKYFYGSRIESTLEPGTPIIGWSADHEQKLTDGEVLESDPPHKLSYTWRSLWDEAQADEEPSRVTWEIAPQEGGVTKLSVVHDRLEQSPKTAESVAGGWMFILSGLKTLLETGEPLAG
jgi:uncharacterized protein YndB with AHSA1/START domain